MKTRPVDVFWLLVIAACAAVLIGTVVALQRQFTLIWLLGLAVPVILAAGAWKRTKWGAPAGGLREHQEARRAGGHSG